MVINPMVSYLEKLWSYILYKKIDISNISFYYIYLWIFNFYSYLKSVVVWIEELSSDLSHVFHHDSWFCIRLSYFYLQKKKKKIVIVLCQKLFIYLFKKKRVLTVHWYHSILCDVSWMFKFNFFFFLTKKIDFFFSHFYLFIFFKKRSSSEIKSIN